MLIENALSNSQELTQGKIDEYNARLDQIKQQKADVDYRINNTKAGHVYVISNIGSFGENIYKIGMTRRLEPEERVRELSGASVPFKYDIHAIIFSQDAPQLEAMLHRTFRHRRVNKVNERKEFFKVTLQEIKQVVNQNHEAIIQFTMKADAREYRETIAIEREAQHNAV